MALLTHVASHSDALVSLLCDQLAVPPDDLFAPEIVPVPTRGIERWLTQRIASDFAVELLLEMARRLALRQMGAPRVIGDAVGEKPDTSRHAKQAINRLGGKVAPLTPCELPRR